MTKNGSIKSIFISSLSSYINIYIYTLYNIDSHCGMDHHRPYNVGNPKIINCHSRMIYSTHKHPHKHGDDLGVFYEIGFITLDYHLLNPMMGKHDEHRVIMVVPSQLCGLFWGMVYYYFTIIIIYIHMYILYIIYIYMYLYLFT